MSTEPGAAGAYSAMPSAGTGPAPAPAGEPPSSVRSAVMLMLVRAGLSVIGLIVLVSTKNTLKADILKRDTGDDTAKVNSLANAAIATGIVFGLIFIVLYVLLALQVRKGKNWARIVTFVLCALDLLSFLGSFVQAAAAISRVVDVVDALMSLDIIILLARSGDYFRSRTPA